MSYQIHHGDCLDVLRTMPDASVDAVVTDPPYGLAFMGKRWDYDVPSVEIWAECLRVLKPGGHLLAFAGTRTQHRMAVRIEDAGFEIRDMIAWVYGSGFPKSLDVSKAIDKDAGAEREVVGSAKNGCGNTDRSIHKTGGFAASRTTEYDLTAPATDAARQWQGWGTALKPALEPITVARKPLDGTVAQNVLAHGTGALNIDGCRVEVSDQDRAALVGREYVAPKDRVAYSGYADDGSRKLIEYAPAGRWPANLIHDGSDEVTGLFPGEDTGSAARFFYCAKASKADRDAGLDGFEKSTKAGSGALRDGGRETQARANVHPTVKPTDLMRYLCRLVTPPGGLVLDPFAGSGSTGKAAVMEGFRFIGIEREAEYVEIARARIGAVQPHLFAAE